MYYKRHMSKQFHAVMEMTYTGMDKEEQRL